MLFKKELFTSEQLYTFDSIGVAINHAALSMKEVERLNSVIDRNQKPEEKKSGKSHFLTLDAQFMEIMAHPWILEASKKVIGEQFRFDHAFMVEQSAGQASLNMHGNPIACQASCYYQYGVGDGTSIWCGRISFGIALTEQSPKIGGFMYIPGSHKSSFNLHGSKVLGDILKNNAAADCIVTPTLEPGDIFMFTDNIVHGTTGEWHADFNRRTLYYAYSPGFMAWRPYSEIEHLNAYATKKIHKQLLRPPFVAEGNKEHKQLWRGPTE